jgi:transposase
MPNAHPRRFRRDVAQVARTRDPRLTPETSAGDFGIRPITLSTWLKRAELENGLNPRTRFTQTTELHESKRAFASVPWRFRREIKRQE